MPLIYCLLSHLEFNMSHSHFHASKPISKRKDASSDEEEDNEVLNIVAKRQKSKETEDSFDHQVHEINESEVEEEFEDKPEAETYQFDEENENEENGSEQEDDENKEDKEKEYLEETDSEDDYSFGIEKPVYRPKRYNTSYVVDWITTRMRDDDNEIHEYPPVNLDAIVMQAENLQAVVDKLIPHIPIGDNDYYTVLKYLVEEGSVRINDKQFLNDQLEQAVKDEEEDQAHFYINHGADDDVGVETAIEDDLPDMLRELDAEVTDERVRLAAESRSLEAVSYFLETHFEDSSKEILTVAAEQKDPELVDQVLDHAELDNVYDLIQALVESDGKELIPVFFKRFSVENVLSEIDQYGDSDLMEHVSKQAAHYLSESNKAHAEISNLLYDFGSQLTISDSLLSYPEEKFSGSVQLENIRKALDKNMNLNDEVRAAANLVGVPLSSTYALFGGSPYHQSPIAKAWHYIRSAKHSFHKHVNVLKSRFAPDDSLPEKEATKGLGNEAHLGIYRTPLEGMNVYREIKTSLDTEATSLFQGNGDLYNLLLREKNAICQKIIAQQPNHHTAIKINVYNDYPCLMVFIKKPHAARKATEPSLKFWTEMVSFYFVGLVNYNAHRAGLNMELMPRPSFGFLTPTIAVCDQSLRLNVGLIPDEYVKVLQDSLVQLNDTLTLLNQTNRDEAKEVNISLPDDCFVTQDAFKTYSKDKKKKITIPDNLIDLLWAKVDRANKTTATNLMRSHFARIGFSIKVYQALSNANSPTEAFLSALRWGVERLQMQNGQLSFNQDKLEKVKSVLSSHTKIKDPRFLKIISHLVSNMQKRQPFVQVTGLINKSQDETRIAIDACLAKETVSGLYSHLEMLNELLFAEVIFSAPEGLDDPYGSDSDTEEEFKECKVHVHSKKVIVENGMRSLLGALHAGIHHLHPDYLNSTKTYKLALKGAYYETRKAVDLLNRFDIVSIPAAEILIHDTNECMTNGNASLTVDKKQLAEKKVLIIDTTSATLEKQHDWISLFTQSPKMEVLLLVSSGFKHEQNGADKNPYGTIRIFTKNKNHLDDIMAFIKSKEKPIESIVNHTLRRTHKAMGFTPTNHSIFKAVPANLGQSGKDKDLKAVRKP